MRWYMPGDTPGPSLIPLEKPFPPPEGWVKALRLGHWHLLRLSQILALTRFPCPGSLASESAKRSGMGFFAVGSNLGRIRARAGREATKTGLSLRSRIHGKSPPRLILGISITSVAMVRL
jgi:hypothetical protein